MRLRLPVLNGLRTSTQVTLCLVVALGIVAAMAVMTVLIDAGASG